MILAIETTGAICSVAILHGEKLIAEKTVNNGLTHSVNLLPMIDSLIKTTKNIEKIAVSAGPGSFTGLRIGIATAKAIAHANNISVITVPTLDALAYNIEDNQIIVPIIDARRNQVYTAIYIRDEYGNIIKQSDYLTIDIHKLLKEVKRISNNQCVFLGDGAKVYKEFIEEAGFNIASENLLLQKASSVGLISKNFSSISYQNLEPIYIRKPQAVRELGKINILEYQDYMLDEVYELLKCSLLGFWSKNTLQKDTELGLTTYFVATKNENNKTKIIGVISIMIVCENGDIINFAVDESYRGEGVGIRLLSALDTVIEEKQIRNLSLEVRESNIIARNFYEKNGFIVDRVRENYYVNPTENALSMSKIVGLFND